MGSVTVHYDEVRRTLSSDALMEHLAQIATAPRPAGSAGEASAFRYLRQCLERYGYCVREDASRCFVSVPQSASFTVDVRDAHHDIDCVTHSMSASTAQDGVSGVLIEVDEGTNADEMRSARGTVRSLALVRGRPSARAVSRLERQGYAAQVYVDGDCLSQHNLSPVAGSPTDRDLAELPTSPVISIREQDGRRLYEALAHGPVRAQVIAKVETGWRTLPLLSGWIRDRPPDEHYVLFGCHVDSWGTGAVDNAAGVAVAIELAKTLATRSQQMHRGVRFVFWSGHEYGLYAGSNWYVDTNWHELYEHAVAYMTIDSPGASNPTHLSRSQVMDELSAVARRAAAVVTGWNVPVPSRPYYGEQPLWRVGVPGINPHRLTRDDRSFMHTSCDQVDLIDPEVLLKDAAIHLTALLSLVEPQRLPFDYTSLANGLWAHVGAVRDCLDVERAAQLCESFVHLAGRLDDLAPDAFNDVAWSISRALIPTLYTVAGRFRPDPLPTADGRAEDSPGFVVGLRDVSVLRKLEESDPERESLRMRLQREVTRLEFALARTVAEISRALARNAT